MPMKSATNQMNAPGKPLLVMCQQVVDTFGDARYRFRARKQRRGHERNSKYNPCIFYRMQLPSSGGKQKKTDSCIFLTLELSHLLQSQAATGTQCLWLNQDYIDRNRP